MVLQHKIMGILPVVGYLLGCVVSHNIAHSSCCAIGLCAAALIFTFRLGNKAIHLAAIYVGNGIGLAMRPAGIYVAGVVVGLNALAGPRVVNANCWHAVLHRYTVGTRKRTEVTVERAVFLHNNDNVFDFVNARFSSRLSRMPADQKTC